MTPAQSRRSRKRHGDVRLENPGRPVQNPFAEPKDEEEEFRETRTHVRKTANAVTREARRMMAKHGAKGERMSERHHALARTICTGVKLSEAAAAIGFELYEVENLVEKDPAFNGLLDLYRDQALAVFKDFHARSLDVTMEAVRRISERLETDDEINLKDLNEVYRTFADRTGHAPTTTSVSVNVKADMGERLEQARLRAREAARTIEHQPKE